MIVQVWPYIQRALGDPDLHDMALDYLAAALPGLQRASKARQGTVRGSDAGNCVLAVHADLMGLCTDFPAETMLTRLDMGSLYGAFIASLFKCAYELKHPEHEVLVEAEGSYAGAICHADILIRERASKKNLFVCEVKTNYKASNPDEPRLAYPHQVLQTGHQACAFEVEQFGIFTLAPAAQWKKGIATEYHRQDNYRTFEWHAAVDEEYGSRLSQAVASDIEAPQCDGKGFWVTFCRFPGCPKRKAS